MRQRNAIFANFVLRFGDKVLLDYLHEVVLPAFTDAGQERTIGRRTRYLIYKARLVQLDANAKPPVWGIAGQFIKDTEITRHQVFEPRTGVVSDVQSLRNAPSAFFVLVLNNHRLIYFPETPDAPELSEFKATVKRFVSEKHTAYIDELHAKSIDSNKKRTKTSLREEHAPPNLEIVALTGAESISAFVKRYQTLRSIEFKVIKPNAEIEGHPIFRQLRELSDELGARDTKMRTSNPEGLDKQKSSKVITDATAQGNQEVTLEGVDADGNALKGNNKEFAIAAPIPKPPKTKAGLVQRLYETFTGLVGSGAIKIGAQDKTAVPMKDSST